MRGALRRRPGLMILLLALVARSASAQVCDRACLSRLADQYFAALTAHDPSKAPLAPNVRFTEQTQVKTVGDD